MGRETQDVMIDSGRHFQKTSGGVWAGQQFMKALKEGKGISPGALRTNDTLQRGEWIAYDTALVEEAQIRLRLNAALIAAGLTQNIPNGLAKTMFMYDRISDMGPAQVSLDGMSKSENDNQEFSEAGIPLPLIHKDFYLNLRRLMASRERGEGLDLSGARAAGRKIGEKSEEMTCIGGKTFGGFPIYGITNHPNRNTASFGTNGAWSAGAKTGADIIADIGTLMAASEADRMYGPWWLVLSGNTTVKLGEDYKANGDRTIRERILSIDGIQNVIVSDQMPASNVVLLQATSDVIQLLQGEPLQTVQWDIDGGFQVNMKGFMIQVPLVKADTQGRSGIVHMT